MRLTFLGTGTSQGVPVIGCRCEVCQSTDVRDNRLRTSAMVECEDCRIIIDAGPDFRQQMLRTGVREIDAILLTHEHKDHTGGLDDVRAFNFVDYPTIRVVDIFATPRTAKCIRKDFDYAFAENKYIGAPEMRLHEIDTTKPFNPHINQRITDGVWTTATRGSISLGGLSNCVAWTGHATTKLICNIMYRCAVSCCQTN